MKKFRQAIALCQLREPELERLNEMAKHAPEMAQDLADLKALCETVKQLAQVALSGDPVGTAPQE